MGLDTSHDCWHGPYSMFMSWREWLAEQVGIPLRGMQGFQSEHADYLSRVNFRDQEVGKVPPIPWSIINHPLVPLLSHSDCDGRIRWWECKDIALALVRVVRESRDQLGHGPGVHRGCYDSMHKACIRFARGCMKAYNAREDVIFR